MRELTEDEIQLALEDGIAGQPLSKTAESLGFKSRMAFYEYCQSHPIFNKALRDARLAGCDYILDNIKQLPESESDPQMMRAKLDVNARLLKLIDPKTYSERIDVHTTQTSDIGSALSRMEQRIASAYNAPQIESIDVTPQKPNKISDLY